MQPKFPCIPVSLDHLRFIGHVVIVAVFNIPLSDKGLEVGAELHAVGWVHVDHLNLSGHTLIVQQGIHNYHGVAQDHAVDPFIGKLICL